VAAASHPMPPVPMAPTHAFGGFRCGTPQTAKSVACSLTINDAGAAVSLTAYIPAAASHGHAHTSTHTVARPIKIGSFSSAHASGGRHVVTVALSSAGVSLLERQKHLAVTLDLSVRPATGLAASTGSQSVRLNAPPSRRR